VISFSLKLSCELRMTHQRTNPNKLYLDNHQNNRV